MRTDSEDPSSLERLVVESAELSAQYSYRNQVLDTAQEDNNNY